LLRITKLHAIEGSTDEIGQLFWTNYDKVYNLFGSTNSIPISKVNGILNGKLKSK